MLTTFAASPAPVKLRSSSTSSAPSRRRRSPRLYQVRKRVGDLHVHAAGQQRAVLQRRLGDTYAIFYAFTDGEESRLAGVGDGSAADHAAVNADDPEGAPAKFRPPVSGRERVGWA
jgi:hypothetical protein